MLLITFRKIVISFIKSKIQLADVKGANPPVLPDMHRLIIMAVQKRDLQRSKCSVVVHLPFHGSRFACERRKQLSFRVRFHPEVYIRSQMKRHIIQCEFKQLFGTIRGIY